MQFTGKPIAEDYESYLELVVLVSQLTIIQRSGQGSNAPIIPPNLGH